MGLIAAFVLFVLALPPVSSSMAGCVFFAALCYHLDARHDQPTIATAESALFGAAIAGYAYWGVHVEGALLITVAMGMLAMMFGICACLTVRIIARCWCTNNAIPALITVPVIWVACESLVNALGLPFSFALLVLEVDAFSQLAHIGGSLFVSAAVIAIQTAMYVGYRQLRQGLYRSAVLWGTGVATVLCGGLWHGHYYSSRMADLPRTALQLVAAQTNVPGDIVTQLGAGNSLQRLQVQHDQIKVLARELHQKEQYGEPTRDGAVVVVWPESAFPAIESAVGNDLDAANMSMPNFTVRHAYGLRNGQQLHSHVQIRDRQNRIVGMSAKQRTIPLIESTLTHAPDRVVHEHSGIRFGTLICYEAVFADGARRLVEQGADWLAVLTNDAYEGPAFLSHMVLGLTRLRAIETGVTMVRAANGGLSAIIQPNGKIDALLPMFELAAVTGRSVQNPAKTFYVRHGHQSEWILYILALGAGGFILLSRKPRRSTLSTLGRRQTTHRYATLQTSLALVFAAITLTAVQDHVMDKLYQQRSMHSITDEQATSLSPQHTSDNLKLSEEAFGFIRRHYGFSVARWSLPESFEDMTRWAKAHGLMIINDGLAALPTRLSHTAPGLVAMPGGVPAVVTGRSHTKVRLYSTRKRRYFDIDIERFESLTQGPVLWFVPFEATFLSVAASVAASEPGGLP